MANVGMAPASPMARYLMELAGADEAVPAAEMDVADELGGVPPDDGNPLRGYDLEFKKKRNRAVLRQMMERAGLHDLARMATIREDRGEE